MNNEKMNQIIDEAYKNYLENFYKLSDSKKWMKEIFYYDGSSNHHVYLKKEFINKIKTDSEFSERWGLKIEERELSLDERMKILINNRTGWNIIEFNNRGHEYMNEENIPTKLITITYNNETIESYE